MKILSVATAWGSQHGGLNVFNFRLCCALSSLKHEVVCFVKSYSKEDLLDAQQRDVILRCPSKSIDEKWVPEDVGYTDFKIVGEVDLLILHDIPTAVFLDHVPKRPKIVVAFVHTLYRDTDYFGDKSDDERLKRIEEQYRLFDKADIVFTAGHWMAEQLIADKPGLKSKIKSFVPGRPDAQPVGGKEEGSLTTFGRLSLDNDKKQAASIIKAYRDLLTDPGLGELDINKMPRLRLLGLNCEVNVQQEIKRDLLSASGWEARVEFLAYKNHYDFESSDVYQVLSSSKIILTPSIVESFGLTSLESICLGVPLIATRRSGFAYELKKLVRIPERSIEWLEVSDFKDLAATLRVNLRRMLHQYDGYKRGAMVLAEAIQAAWPSWTESCTTMLQDISAMRLNKPKPIYKADVSKPAGGAFSALRALLPSRPSEDGSEGGDAGETERGMPGSEASGVSSREPLVSLAQLCYARNPAASPVLRKLISQRYDGKKCTDLQQQLVESLGASFPHDYQDILLCGGTSSGKTTAAELLFGLANNSDFPAARILYMAPTRALAQERWREWAECFKDLPISRCDENVILSTGEDHSSDRALARGDFLIACLVFEKANVILSTSPDLVKRLTMVIVDELHMIADIHRGPIIETLLAKIKYEKRRRQRQEDLQAPFRIVGITTEQTTAESFGNYFTNLDRKNDRDIAPLKAMHIGRPAKVKHILVEPENTGQTSYRKTEIATFAPQVPLWLSQDELDAFGAKLTEHNRSGENSPGRGERTKRQKYEEKYLHFIKDWISEHQYGRRLLAFIGSKAEQVNLANRLQSEIKKTHSLAERSYNVERLESVLDKIRNDDTSVSVDVLARAIDKGIFIHNADINRNLRFAMEDYLTQALPAGAASEVIIATETLSYGVNLAIDDVALLSLQFPASERNQEYGATPKLLSRCAFANMCGRAGRLNQRDAEATVYIWPITDQQSGPRRLVEIFYNEEEHVASRIVHGDDKEAYDRVKRNDRFSQAPLLFTYPFVKTFLDGLRFTGGSPGLNGATRRNDASFEELEEEFTEHLLYAHENRLNADNLRRLNESVRLVVAGSMEPALELVKKSGRGYKITQLGSSIIDTGTEISTLEPLKRALEMLLKRLREKMPMDEVPVEVLLLSIVVQNEAHRQVISGMPEFRTDVVLGENRAALLEWVGATFADWGFGADIISAMSAFLEDCDRDPRHAPAGETSTPVVHDACVRLFCGLLMWVSGHSIGDIHIKLKSIGKFGGNLVDINTNFATFADRISWKLMFLGDLMRYTRTESDLRMLQTKARRLTTRLQQGCAENALPFLAREGNRASTISRKIAHEILRAGATPKTISSGEFTLDAYAGSMRSRIKTQVRNYIRSSFHHLKSEFVYYADAQGPDAISSRYWEFADEVIRKSTEENREVPVWPIGPSEEAIVSVAAGPGVSDADSPKVRFREESGLLYIIGHKLRWDDDVSVPTDAIRWQVQALYGSNDVRPAPEGYRTIVVDFPWLLNAVPTQSNVVRMSPAAFGIFLTLITRSFFKDSLRALEILGANNTSISSLSLIDLLYSEVTLTQLPEALFDAWAGYWDAE